MKRCKYCHKLIWFWQSYLNEPDRVRTHEYAILIVPAYERHMHEGCHFNFLLNKGFDILEILGMIKNNA